MNQMVRVVCKPNLSVPGKRVKESFIGADIKESSDKYLASSHILSHFLDFQKSFGIHRSH